MGPYGGAGYDGVNYGSNYGGYGDSSLLGGIGRAEDLNRNGIPDHLEATKDKIDNYLAKTQQLGQKRLSVQVDYLNTPLEYQYLNQYHGFEHPLQGTPLGDYFKIPVPQPVLPQQFIQAPQQFQQPQPMPPQPQQPAPTAAPAPKSAPGSVKQ